MDKQAQNRLKYLRANKNYLSPRELEELTALEADQNRSSGKSVAVPASISQSFEAKRKNEQKKRPQEKVPRKKWHLLRWGVGILLIFVLTLVGFYLYGYQRGVSHMGGAAKPEVFNGQKTSEGATNILLLGADQRPNQSSDVAHSDSIMVLQLGAKDHQVKLISFMRDTLVNVPGVSQGTDADTKINSAYTVGEQNNHQGAELMRETLKNNFGIETQYYAVVDFSSFATIIDSLFPNGLEIDAQFSTINGETLPAVPVPDDMAATEGKVSSDQDLTADEAAAMGYPDGGGTFMMIKPGKQKMNGRTLLNYARFRHDDQNDFGRVARQQQVMEAVFSSVKNPFILFTGASALGTARAVTETNLPTSFLLFNSLGFLLDAKGGIKTSTVPDISDTSNISNAYDQYGGLGLSVNLTDYQTKLQGLLGN